MFSHRTRRLAAVTVAGGLVALGQLGIASSASADDDSPADCPAYSVTAPTNTEVSTSPAKPGAGDDFTATADVTTGGVPVTSGDVTFTFAGESQTVAVSGGSASADFTVPAEGGSFTLTASYSGQCLGSSSAIGTSSGSQAIVAGVEASAGGGGSENGGLAATGVNGQTELFGALGVGLVAVGALTLVVHRRRVQG